MSGFAGMVSLDGAPPDAQLLQRMAERLAFRGPDGMHITTKPGAGFCFTFLRTGPAPQCPSQPCSLDGRVWLLGDVRLDGRDDLRRKLEQHGDKFDGEVTDEELVLRVWRRWGEEGLPDLLGDYAFALWDVESRKLWCARDLMGARPFFYAQTGNQLYFSNALDAVRCNPEISRELDLSFIGDFLLQDWYSAPQRSAFRSISRLPAGHLLHFFTDYVEVRRFAAVPIEEPLWLKCEQEYVERFRTLLEQAVAERLPPGPVSIFMSGGLDSTSLAALAVETATKRGAPLDLCAYTIDYRPLFSDTEGELATITAKHLGINIRVMSGGRFIPYDHWTDTDLPIPEPCNEPFRSLYVTQHQQASKHSQIALNGYGGDGILTGQAWPYLTYLMRRLRLARLGKDFGHFFWIRGRLPPLRGGFRNLLRRWVGSGSHPEYPRWLASGFEKDLRLPERWNELQRPHKKVHPWYPDAYHDLDCGPVSSVLESEDPLWTGVAVESRAPMLDLRFVRFLLRIPPVPLCIDKELLRRAVGDLLPEEIRQRKKHALLGDPLRAQVQKGRWKPPISYTPPESMSALVNWPKVMQKLNEGEISSRSPELRPLSLAYWLQDLERRRWLT
jgi:asparagine synthase (glutamine-hydrolysing)